MGRVPEQGDIARNTAVRWLAVEQGVQQHLLGWSRAYDFRNRRSEVRGACGKLARVELSPVGHVPVDPSVAQRQETRSRSLRPPLPRGYFPIPPRNAAKGDDAGVGWGPVAQDGSRTTELIPSAPTITSASATDSSVNRTLLPLSDAAVRPVSIRAAPSAPIEAVVEIGAVIPDEWLSVPLGKHLRIELRKDVAIGSPQGATAGNYHGCIAEPIEPESAKRPASVRPDGKPGSERTDLICPLVDRDIETGASKRDPGGEAADPCSDDRRGPLAWS